MVKATAVITGLSPYSHALNRAMESIREFGKQRENLTRPKRKKPAPSDKPKPKRRK